MQTPVSAAQTTFPAELTPRELEVLECLVRGMSYKGIASALRISHETVRSHIRAVYRKLRVHKMTQAVGRALTEGLLQ